MHRSDRRANSCQNGSDGAAPPSLHPCFSWAPIKKFEIAFAKTLAIAVALVLATAEIHAQQFQRNVFAPLIQLNTGSLAQSSLGGVYVPKLSFVDIDADGDVDLLIVQPDGRVSFYRNTGTPATAAWTWVTDFFDSLNVGPWAIWHDLDNDGDPDMLAGRNNSTFAYYENNGNGHFTVRADPVVDSTGSSILSEAQSIPTLCDIDGDGDLDFFTGRSSGTLAFYRNVGSVSVFSLKFVTEKFEDITIITPAKPSASGLHGASSVNFVDIDHDGDPDLFWGDFFSSSIYFLKNVGDSITADIPGITTSQYPSSQMVTAGFNRPVFTDIDNDGDLDLFVAAIFRDTETDNFWFFRNDGSASLASYTLVTRNYLPQLDVGRYANPVWVDIDDDQDLDLFVGSYAGPIRFFRNVGTDTVSLIQDTTVSLPIPSDVFVTVPSFADVDGDGDFDAVIGNFNGRLLFYRNTGNASSPIFTLESQNYAGIDVGNYSAPTFADMDGDGDTDLLIGEETGSVNWLRNSSGSNVFVSDTLIENFISWPGMNDAVPECVDIDGDGDVDMLVGVRSGQIGVFENKGQGNFVLRDPTFMAIKSTGQAVPRIIDWDRDGDPDFVIGTQRGGWEFYENRPAVPFLFPITPDTTFAAKAYSNDVFSYGNPLPAFELLSAPDGMTIDSATGQIFWTPAVDQIGEWTITVRSRNALGFHDRTFPLLVRPSVPPAITTALFANPALPTYMDISVTSDEILIQPPVVQIWKTQDTTTIPMIAVDPRVFRGVVKLSASGLYTVRVRANGIGGKDSIQVRTVTVVLTKSGEAFELHNLTGQVSVIGTGERESLAFHMTDTPDVFVFSQDAIVRFLIDTLSAGPLSIVRTLNGLDESVSASVDVRRKTASATFSAGGKFRLQQESLPQRYHLYANYPNPFNPSTTIRFDLTQDTPVDLSVYNTLGQKLRTLEHRILPGGNFQYTWDGRDDSGRIVSSGLYIVRLKAKDYVASRKMLLIR